MILEADNAHDIEEPYIAVGFSPFKSQDSTAKMFDDMPANIIT
jgi:hypothetical protein